MSNDHDPLDDELIERVFIAEVGYTTPLRLRQRRPRRALTNVRQADATVTDAGSQKVTA